MWAPKLTVCGEQVLVLYNTKGERLPCLELKAVCVQCCRRCGEVHSERLGGPSAQRHNLIFPHSAINCVLCSPLSETMKPVAGRINPVSEQSLVQSRLESRFGKLTAVPVKERIITPSRVTGEEIAQSLYWAGKIKGSR